MPTHVQEPRSDGFFKNNFLRLFLLALFILLLILTLAFVYGRVRVNLPGRASTSGSLSIENSYIFASPLSACADGIGLIRVTVFLLTSEGLGLSGQSVTLTVPGGVTVSSVQGVTDSIGKAYFDLATFTPGTYTIQAEVNSQTLPQTVNVGFLEEGSCR